MRPRFENVFSQPLAGNAELKKRVKMKLFDKYIYHKKYFANVNEED